MRRITVALIFLLFGAVSAAKAQVDCQAILNQLLSGMGGPGVYSGGAENLGNIYNTYCLGGGQRQQQYAPPRQQVGDYCADGGTCPVGSRCTSDSMCMPAGNTECGNHSCRPGSFCGSRNQCLTDGTVDCGNGTSCSAGSKCSRNGQKCLTTDTVDCGTFFCNAGSKCGSGNKCLQQDAVDCGRGRSCSAGYLCVAGGAECLTSQQITARREAEKEAERRRREEKIEATRQKEEERKAEIARKHAEAEAKRQAAIDAKRQAEETRRLAAAAEARRKADEAARAAAAAEAKRKNEAEAKQKADEARRAEETLLKTLQVERDRQRKAEEELAASKKRREAEEKVAAAKAASEKATADKLAAIKAASDKAAAEKGKEEKAIADKAAAIKLAADKAAADKAAVERATRDKAIVEKIAADKIAADKLAVDKAAREKAIADKAAADKAIRDKAIADKSAADNLAAETKQANDAESKRQADARTPPIYTFKETPSKTIEVLKNGSRIATVSAELASKQYGYQLPSTLTQTDPQLSKQGVATTPKQSADLWSKMGTSAQTPAASSALPSGTKLSTGIDSLSRKDSTKAGQTGPALVGTSQQKEAEANKIATLNAETQRLTAQYGSTIDSKTATQVLSYAQMSKDAYSDKGGNLGVPGVRRISDWETVLKSGGFSTQQIDAVKRSGFYASIYRNDKTGEITVSFRGTEPSSIGRALPDFATDLNASVAGTIRKFDPRYVDPQYQAAADLARIVKEKWPAGTQITLTGFSLGGGLASYAGPQANISSVVTFNAARNVFSTSGNNPNQINVSVPGELVGDSNTRSAFGGGALPGRLYSVTSPTDRPGLIGDLTGTHSLEGIIGGLNKTIQSGTP